MLRFITAALLCTAAGAAAAASIEPYKATSSTRTSIVEVGCLACARQAAEVAKEAEVKLRPGEKIVEAREIDGHMMIYRTDNMLGGSPVTMVRRASEAELIALGVAPPKTETAKTMTGPTAEGTQWPAIEMAVAEPPIANMSAPGIDTETKTSALGSVRLDPSKFKLRLH